MAIGGVAPTIPAGMAIAPTLFIIFILFCGFLAPRDSMPDGWRWLNTISFETYAFKGLAVNELYDLTWTCEPYETLLPELTTCQLVDGHDALKLYDMDVGSESDKWGLTLSLFYFYCTQSPPHLLLAHRTISHSTCCLCWVINSNLQCHLLFWFNFLRLVQH
jgi:hypothetical protein